MKKLPAIFSSSTKPISILALGDSYTIGEAVRPADRFVYQFIRKAKKEWHLSFARPDIIAQTGWTTDELWQAIQTKSIREQYDVVTLLVGVNNQYRGRSLQNYRKEFKQLLSFSLQKVNGQSARVRVLSIPDWGATPFVAQDKLKRTPGRIAREIDNFNRVNKAVADSFSVRYVDITPISRLASKIADLTASDGLHPSGKMYALWSDTLFHSFSLK